MKKYIFIISLFIAQLTIAQNNRQNIRGVVTDKLTQTTLPGATVQIINGTASTGAITDANGIYILPDMAPDRYEIKVSYIGYKDVFASNVVVTSGKEVVLDIAMEEDLKLLDEVVITANLKAGTINNLIPVSARTFSTEEVNRYAGGRSDPARLAANFAVGKRTTAWNIQQNVAPETIKASLFT